MRRMSMNVPSVSRYYFWFVGLWIHTCILVIGLNTPIIVVTCFPIKSLYRSMKPQTTRTTSISTSSLLATGQQQQHQWSTSSPPPPTLRQFLTDESGFHLAMGPSFFGFYAYFGALTSLNEDVLDGGEMTTTNKKSEEKYFLVPPRQIPKKSTTLSPSASEQPHYFLKSIGGASAGAMAAALLAAGCNPRDAADFACSLTLSSFADPLGLGGILRGKKFERLLEEFILQHQMRKQQNQNTEIPLKDSESNYDASSASANNAPTAQPRLEDTTIPVALSVYDVLTRQGVVLQEGSMARAIRASATYPGLFQPVSWSTKRQQRKQQRSSNDSNKSLTVSSQRSFLIDGGVTDNLGLLSLTKLLGFDEDNTPPGNQPQPQPQRVLNLNVGTYEKRYGEGPPPGPSDVSTLLLGVDHCDYAHSDDSNKGEGSHSALSPVPPVKELVSMTIENAPKCGPFAMKNGPKAVEAARLAVLNHLDVPMTRGKEPGHYELHIDASVFCNDHTRQ